MELSTHLWWQSLSFLHLAENPWGKPLSSASLSQGMKIMSPAALWVVNECTWCLGLHEQVTAWAVTGRLLQHSMRVGTKAQGWAMSSTRQAHSSAHQYQTGETSPISPVGRKAATCSTDQEILAAGTPYSCTQSLVLPPNSLQFNQEVAEIYYTDVSWLHTWTKVSFQKTGHGISLELVTHCLPEPKTPQLAFQNHLCLSSSFSHFLVM